MDDHAAVTLGVSLKLYLDTRSTVAWARAVGELARRHPAVQDGSVRLFALPSLPALLQVRDALDGSAVGLGAQDLFWEDRGAYTGAVSGTDLRQVGCSYVEVGHAERRAVFGEDDEIIRKKLAAAVRNGLTPVLCVGEDVREAAPEAVAQCLAQIDAALGDASTVVPELIVAYEPVWAIGAAQPAPAEWIAEVSAALRTGLSADPRVAASTLIYGGSAQPGLLGRLGGSVDGLFLGRFAHDPEQLERVVDEAAAMRSAHVGERGGSDGNDPVALW
ncbi:triose-phosphate isomerase [Microbacterium kribbense]|uniref:Triosephosphate isomerase n=1 Tax=Microbacterium kribbense TaxID=433645 RepID=A0ABP7GTB9_9MICO